MIDSINVEDFIRDYPFLQFINEDKSHYPRAIDKGYVDSAISLGWSTPDDLFLIGDSGGFLMDIQPGGKFVNTHLFTEVADYYREHGQYHSYRKDSLGDRQFREREKYRRYKGMRAPCYMKPNGEIVEIRITGEHYNFMNYVPIEQLDESSISIGNVNTAKKIQDFPKFFDAQFWIFHILEFAKKNGFHAIIDKTRRAGFSYMMASRSSNTVNLFSKKVVIHVAADSKYLTMKGGLTTFSVNNLNFYEENSPFVRGVYKGVVEDFRLGYKLPNGREAVDSWGSSLISVSANNSPDCAIGKDAVEINVEELSTMTNFDEFMTVTEPAMRTGAYTTGMLTAWGTATSGDMTTFERNFYDVKGFGFFPMENVWDKDARGEICGIFKPYCWSLQGEINGQKGIDEFGNSNIEVSLRIALAERIKKKQDAKTFGDYINYLGQYALSPSESFSSYSENIFSSSELNDWENRLRIENNIINYIDGIIEEIGDSVMFVSNERLLNEGKKVYDYIKGVPRKTHEDPTGCIRVFFMPEVHTYRDSGGNMVKGTPPNLYSITYDPVGIDKDKKDITDKHSHNSIEVWQDPHETNGYKQKLVATYYGRPEKLKEADRICYNLARLYNCIGNVHVEVNRGETVSNFRSWGALKYLAKEDLSVFDVTMKGKVSTSYGYIISEGIKKLEALRLLKEFLYHEIGKDEYGNPICNFHRIFDYQHILELKKWNNVANFDRVSSMLIRGIRWKSMQLKAERELETKKNINSDPEVKDILDRDWFD